MYDPDDESAPPPRPQLEPVDFDQLREACGLKGPAAAADWLCEKLLTLNDYPSLFYALLMKERIRLGASPFPAGPASDLPAEHHEAYEEAIRHAGRTVGQLFLKENDFPRAWGYYQMLGEPGPVVEALNAYQPGPDEDVQPLIEVALHHGAAIPRGFDLVVERYGICNAITTYSGLDFSKQPTAKQHCLRTLVNALYSQLEERLKSDLTGRGIAFASDEAVADLVAAHDELFAEDAYHIDTSHLSSVVQYAIDMEPCPELTKASGLAAYGARLGDGYQMDQDPPFEKGHADHRIYLDVLRGVHVEAGLAHFAAKIAPALLDQMTRPAEVYTNLLLRLGRTDEAREIAKKYLAGVQGRAMACPGVYELCLQAKDYGGLADAARTRADGVSYLAAVVSAANPRL